MYVMISKACKHNTEQNISVSAPVLYNIKLFLNSTDL